MSDQGPGQGQGLAPGQEQELWDGPPGHAAATAKAAGKSRMEKERDEALKKTIAKKLPHNIGQSRSPPLLPPVAPAPADRSEGAGLGVVVLDLPISLKDGKGDEDVLVPYPPANTPMMGHTPGINYPLSFTLPPPLLTISSLSPALTHPTHNCSPTFDPLLPHTMAALCDLFLLVGQTASSYRV